MHADNSRGARELELLQMAIDDEDAANRTASEGLSQRGRGRKCVVEFDRMSITALILSRSSRGRGGFADDR